MSRAYSVTQSTTLRGALPKNVVLRLIYASSSLTRNGNLMRRKETIAWKREVRKRRRNGRVGQQRSLRLNKIHIKIVQVT